MKKSKFVTSLLLYVSFVLAMQPAQSQILVTSGSAVTANDLVESIITEGITYYNAQFIGHESSKGIFSNGASTNLGIDNGIVLSTGYAADIQGPNSSGSTSGIMNITSPPHPFIFPNTYDPAVLSFTVIPETDTLRLTYVFGSELYNEWVGSSLTDAFGIFISGPDPAGGNYVKKNIALVPGTASTEVSVNNVNNGYAPVGVPPTGPCTNCEFYNDNTSGLTIEYDGFTTVLTAWALVVPCQPYEIVMGVADVGDSTNDTGVAIEENSIAFPEITLELILDPPDIADTMIEGCVRGDVIFRLPTASYSPVTICFEVTGTATNGVDYEWIDNCITFQAGSDTASLKIVPLRDGIIEGVETVILIPENTLGCVVRYDTTVLYINDYIDMSTITGPDLVICPGKEAEIWVSVANGLYPFTYTWEPGQYSGSNITVSPDTTTWYFVTITDLCMDTIIDSVLVFVLQGHLNEMIGFSFEADYNPILTEDITGTISGDSVFVLLPSAQGIDNLIASFIVSICAEAYIGDELQISGLTANDFTNPVTYEVVAANGDVKEWVVVVDIVSGHSLAEADDLALFPNPANDRIRISGAAGFTAMLFDMLGTRLMREVITTPNATWEISHLEPGIYFLHFERDGQIITRKVVVCR